MQTGCVCRVLQPVPACQQGYVQDGGTLIGYNGSDICDEED